MAIAIANEKVVAQALIIPRQVLAVYRLSGSEGLAKVVHNNAGPAVAIEICLVGQQEVISICRLILKWCDIGEREPTSLAGCVDGEHRHGASHGQRK